MLLAGDRAHGDRDRSHRRSSMGLHVAVSRGCLRISWLRCSQVRTLSSLGISMLFEMQSNIFVCGSQARRGACSALCFGAQ